MKFTSTTTHFVNFGELERFIKDTYGVVLEVAASEECENDVSLHFSITGELYNFEEDEMQEFLAGGYISYGATRLALTKLCRDGKIPAGKWIVQVSW